MPLAPEQIRAARALLRIEQAELAESARVSMVTIRRAEGAAAQEQVSAATLAAIQRALEQAGAEFIAGGVRRRAATTHDTVLFNDLRALSLASAAQLQDRPLMAEADLYDEHGLPA